MRDNEENHPAFGSIAAHRVSASPGQPLFDSDVLHRHYVQVTISRAVRYRDLNTDWLHPTTELIQVDMSEAQWASFVSSMNTSGVPCTLHRVDGERVDPVEYSPRLQLSMDETKAAARKAYDGIKKALSALESLDPKAGVKARRQAMNNLHYAIENAEGEVAFASKQLAEHTENVVQRARADIEAMVTNKAVQLGIDSAEFSDTLAIGGGSDEVQNG